MTRASVFFKKFFPALLIAALWLVSSAGTAEAGRQWQLLFHYNQQKLELVEAVPIPQMTKAVRTPGLVGAPVRLPYSLSWLDNKGQTLVEAETQVPLGMRVILTEDEPCREFMPDSGYVIVRADGPSAVSAPTALKMVRRGQAISTAVNLATPPPFSAASVTLSIPVSTASAALAGPVSWQKIRDTGPDDNRLVIVILGDGYTAANLATGQFTSDAANLESAFYAKAPWDNLFNATNIYRVDIESNEQGADNETYGVYKDTYLNSSFWVSDIERLLALTGNGLSRAQAAANAAVGVGVWDVLLVLVNSTKYGGSGGSVAVSSVHSSASEIVLHELGHSFAFLADEYETAYPGYPAGDYEPNVDYDYSGAGLKWLDWVEAGTPLPTPETYQYDNVVGAFEGARYLTSGIYRPWNNCLMRSLGREFCPVCKEAIAINFGYAVQLADEVEPANGSTVAIPSTGTTFTATPVPLANLAYQWYLDGSEIDGANDQQLTLTADEMTADTQTLSLEVRFATPLVRKTTIADLYSWTLNKQEPTCCIGWVGNANGSEDETPTIGDISIIIDHLYISGVDLPCYTEADVNLSGAPNPGDEDITIGDISLLIDHLYIKQNPLSLCP